MNEITDYLTISGDKENLCIASMDPSRICLFASCIEFYSLKEKFIIGFEIEELIKFLVIRDLKSAAIIIEIYPDSIIFILNSPFNKELETYKPYFGEYENITMNNLLQIKYPLQFSVSKEFFTNTLRLIKSRDWSEILTFKIEKKSIELISINANNINQKVRWLEEEINWIKFENTIVSSRSSYSKTYLQNLKKIIDLIPNYGWINFYIKPNHPLRITIPTLKPLPVSFTYFLAPRVEEADYEYED